MSSYNTLTSRNNGLTLLASLAFGYGMFAFLTSPAPRQRRPSPTVVSVYDRNTGQYKVKDRVLHQEYRDPTGRIILHLDNEETLVLGCGPEDGLLILRRMGT